MSEAKPYTVYGIYTDNMQRCGLLVFAHDADEAEALARAEAQANGAEGLLVAAVLAGEHASEDSHDRADEGPQPDHFTPV